ncbi:MAG: hypothetical protein JSW73_02105 [Candidatus Woesearchaeota archaeon]|nr:MAG: hypothetical protein JSW73_02105 [Candidatus Woesearchaeota archaeon]
MIGASIGAAGGLGLDAIYLLYKKGEDILDEPIRRINLAKQLKKHLVNDAK